MKFPEPEYECQICGPTKISHLIIKDIPGYSGHYCGKCYAKWIKENVPQLKKKYKQNYPKTLMFKGKNKKDNENGKKLMKFLKKEDDITKPMNMVILKLKYLLHLIGIM